MKRHISIIISCLIVLLVGCPNPMLFPPANDKSFASLQIDFNYERAMQIQSSIFPDSIWTTVTSFELSGSGPAGATESWSGSDTSVVLDEIIPGDWTFSTEGKNADGTVICSGSTDATLVSGAVNSVTITLSLSTGSGIANISLSWPADILGSPETSTSLSHLATSQDYPQSLTISGDSASGSTGLIPSGAYLLTITLTDSGSMVAAPTRVVWVFPGVTTNADISLGGEELKAAPVAPSLVMLDNQGATTIDVSWSDNSDVEHGFKILRMKESESVFTEIVTIDPNITSYSDTSADTEEGYEYIVRAFNDFGYSDSAVAFTFHGSLFTLTFADANLEEAIFDLATAEGYTYASEITSLSAIAVGIADLSGIEALTNLQTLYLSDNSISDVTPLSGLTFLTYLTLSDNQITTGVAELVTLTAADTINFKGNPDIPSGDLDTLEAALSDTLIIKPGATLIADLVFADANLAQAVSDRAADQGHTYANQILYLSASSKGISDLEGIEELTSLQTLKLYTNSITDIGPLSGLTNLTELNLQNNSIGDISALSGMANLRSFTVSNNSITNIGAISGMTHLQYVYLENNAITDISAFSGLTEIGQIWLDGNSISDVSAFSGLTSVYSLDLHDNLIVDVTPLAGLTGLYLGLDLSENQITTGVAELVTLTQANLISFAGNPDIPSADLDTLEAALPDTLIIRPGATLIADLVFADANLAQAVSDRAADQGHTYANQILYLSASSKGISDLEGIEELTSLQTLKLYTNSITDIGPLSGLTNLTELNLQNNSIGDISALSGMANLRSFTVSNNSITNIGAISGMTHLQYVYLENNAITDISAFSGLTEIGQIWLDGNSISDVSAFSGLTSVYSLDLHDNLIVDVTPLAGLTGLYLGLDLSENQITTGVAELVTLTQANLISFAGNPDIPSADLDTLEAALPDTLIIRPGATLIADLVFADANLAQAVSDRAADQGHTYASQILYLSASSKGISDLEGIEELTSLQTLKLYTNSITDIGPLSGLTNLTELNLQNNSIGDISALSGMANLRSFTVSNNSITNIGAISGMTHLQYVYLENNAITDISAFSGLTEIGQIWLDGNSISDVSAFSGLTSVYSLDLHDNLIVDVTPLAGLTGLYLGLDLSENQITTGVAELVTLTQANLISFAGNPDIPSADLDTLEAALPETVIIRP